LKFIKKLLLPFVALIFLTEGCVPSKPIEDEELLSSERLINKLEANRRKIKNFEGIGVFEIESEQFNNSANFQIIMQKPDSIYFTVLGPFGIELAQALVTKDRYIFYDALQNTAYRGRVDDDILKNIFKVNLSFTDLLDAFIGSVNLTPNLYKQPSSYSVEGEQYVLTYVDREFDLTSVYKVDIRQLGITNYSLKSKDDTINFEGKYSKFELIENVAIPFSIEIKNKVQNQKVSIRYKNIDANLKGLRIKFELPGDAEIIEW
jgi:outer membrane lipoprotein-sorting protein